MTLTRAGEIMGELKTYSTEIEMRQYAIFKNRSLQIFRVKANSEYTVDSILSIGIFEVSALSATSVDEPLIRR